MQYGGYLIYTSPGRSASGVCPGQIFAFVLPLRCPPNFGAGAARTRFTSLDRHDTNSGFGPSLTDQLTPHWSWRAEFLHHHLSSTQADRGYTDNIAFFALAYKR